MIALSVEIETTPKLVGRVYAKLDANVAKFRKVANRPLTLSEKILAGHLDGDVHDPQRGGSYVFLNPDRVALQDVTGQMTILQFA